MKKLLPPKLFYCCIALMALLRWLAPAGVFIHYPYNLPGLLLFAAGAAIAIRGKGMFREAGTEIKTFEKPELLITHGLFRYSRNPMYVGFALALTGAAVLLGNLSSLFVVAAFVAITDRWYIVYEERVLEREFGTAFETYRRTTQKWI